MKHRSYVNTYFGSAVLGTAACSLPELKSVHPCCPYGQVALQIPSAAVEGSKILLRSLGLGTGWIWKHLNATGADQIKLIIKKQGRALGAITGRILCTGREATVAF